MPEPRTGGYDRTITASDEWQAATQRLSRLPRYQCKLFRDLLETVEEGWKPVRSLHTLTVERPPAAAEADEAWRSLREFIEEDVVDLFRTIALDVAELVPGWEGWASTADPGEIDSDVRLLGRHLVVAGMAAGAPSIAAEARDSVTDAVARFQGWTDRVVRQLARVDELVVRPSLEQAGPF